MKYQYQLLMLITAIILAACTPTVSDTDLQTAIAQVVETSAAASVDTQPASSSAADAERELAQAQLDAANLVLTAQAGQLAVMQEQLNQIQLALTPTITPTPAATATITPLPTATANLLPDDQKIVYATRQTGLYTYTEKNGKGYPVMLKTDPIVRYEAGDWMIVYKALVQGDGGTLFYKVISPYGGGYYVDVNHVRD